MHIHFVRPKDAEWLERHFAALTSTGWVVPDWVKLLLENKMVKLTKSERADMACEIVEAMRATYEAEGIEGDFDDGERYLRDDASDAELRDEHAKWCPAKTAT